MCDWETAQALYYHQSYFILLSLPSPNQMGEVWSDLHPKLSCLFGGSNGLQSPPLSPK